MTYYGYSYDESLTLRIADLHPAEDIPRLRDYLTRTSGLPSTLRPPILCWTSAAAGWP